MFKKILLATDGSDASAHAASMAVNMARACGAKLLVVYVVDPYPYLGIGEMNPYGFQSYITVARELSVTAFAHVKQQASNDGAAVPFETRLLEDVTVHKGILQAAADDESDLIIIGSHGRSGIEKFLIGSIASKVVAHAVTPVLVVR